MNPPEVSVVMGVFNGAEVLVETLDSVLSQKGVEFEFIVIDDGSTDRTAEILQLRMSLDPRLRVVCQKNAGLTAALIAGCRLARGTFIARQDAGDLSLPGRLHLQALYLKNHPEVVLVSCGTRFVLPSGVLLYDEVVSQERLDDGLRSLSIASCSGPSHHGSCMFRRQAYEQLGGYRLSFSLAQDLDLWLRMFEYGRLVTTEDVLYQASWSFGGLSSRLRSSQSLYAGYALHAARLRRAGRPEFDLPEPRPTNSIDNATPSNVERSRMNYFVGSCLAKRDRILARKYFWLSFQAHPLNLRAIFRLACTYA